MASGPYRPNVKPPTAPSSMRVGQVVAPGATGAMGPPYRTAVMTGRPVPVAPALRASVVTPEDTHALTAERQKVQKIESEWLAAPLISKDWLTAFKTTTGILAEGYYETSELQVDETTTVRVLWHLDTAILAPSKHRGHYPYRGSFNTAIWTLIATKPGSPPATKLHAARTTMAAFRSRESKRAGPSMANVQTAVQAGGQPGMPAPFAFTRKRGPRGWHISDSTRLGPWLPVEEYDGPAARNGFGRPTSRIIETRKSLPDLGRLSQSLFSIPPM